MKDLQIKTYTKGIICDTGAINAHDINRGASLFREIMKGLAEGVKMEPRCAEQESVS